MYFAALIGRQMVCNEWLTGHTSAAAEETLSVVIVTQHLWPSSQRAVEACDQIIGELIVP